MAMEHNDGDFRLGDKAVVELYGLIVWGYVVSVEVMFDESLNYSDMERVRPWTYVTVRVEDIVDEADRRYFENTFLYRETYQVYAPHAIPIAD